MKEGMTLRVALDIIGTIALNKDKPEYVQALCNLAKEDLVYCWHKDQVTILEAFQKELEANFEYFKERYL